MDETLKIAVLLHNGIQSEQMQKTNSVLRNCQRCSVTNALEAMYYVKFSYPLRQEAYEDTKAQEAQLVSELQEKLVQMKEDNDKRYLQVMALIRLNSVLSNLKSEELAKLATERMQKSEEWVH